ncbi:hypothetical protein [Parasitella parasitica]|uniref:Helitron helicase-like domain-containing protein n=1 Tax=Parasitella parasitica TaxID=35722 RepID=A0A0B7NVJ4_9FUNG|nr:hypothetical protein [Parasitella parasitica]
MSLVRRFRKPDLFIPFTCNPAWPEIASELKASQRPSDCLDLYTRIFNLKLMALFHDIVERSALGKVVEYCNTMKFQKRGPPHCHMLFILSEDDKARTPEDFNNIVNAKTPDSATRLLAYETVTAAMIQSPCGLFNPEAPCRKNVVCSKRHPSAFNEKTTLGNFEGEKLPYR